MIIETDIQRVIEQLTSDVRAVKDRDELTALLGRQRGVAEQVTTLAREIANKTGAHEMVARDITIAREVQSRLFPQKSPPMSTLQYAGSCVQARTIGGDYYDYLDMGNGRVGLALGDISGKGIFAALLMANLQANLRSQYAIALDDPARLMRSVNRLFYDSVTPGLFATLFFADYSDATRALRYVNCGHNPPLLLRRSGQIEKLHATATVLGVFDEWDCEVGEARLGPGDTLVIYSDGVIDAATDAGELFGDTRLAETVRASAHLPVAGVLQAISDTVQRFSGIEQEDDLTLLVARAR